MAEPEGVKRAAEQTAAQGDDGICAVCAPEHAGPLKALGDNRPATRFHHAGAYAKAKGTEVIIPHAVTVVIEVSEFPGGFCSHLSGTGCIATDGSQHTVQVA